MPRRKTVRRIAAKVASYAAGVAANLSGGTLHRAGGGSVGVAALERAVHWLVGRRSIYRVELGPRAARYREDNQHEYLPNQVTKYRARRASSPRESASSSEAEDTHERADDVA